MGDPLSIASGVLALSIFAFKSSVSLYEFVQSFQDKGKKIRELRRELEALRNTLNSLQQLATEDEVRFEALCLPLLRCGQTCKEFEEVIANSTKHSTDSKKSFRDWAKLQYLGGNIEEFKDLLAGYKATISYR
jgi:cell shape-determining protein MreC